MAEWQSVRVGQNDCSLTIAAIPRDVTASMYVTGISNRTENSVVTILQPLWIDRLIDGTRD